MNGGVYCFRTRGSLKAIRCLVQSQICTVVLVGLLEVRPILRVAIAIDFRLNAKDSLLKISANDKRIQVSFSCGDIIILHLLAGVNTQETSPKSVEIFKNKAQAP